MENFKKKYISPSIEGIVLDNEISLQLESEPPYGPGENGDAFSQNFRAPEFFSNNPYEA